jgi:hypothetical protein
VFRKIRFFHNLGSFAKLRNSRNSSLIFAKHENRFVASFAKFSRNEISSKTLITIHRDSLASKDTGLFLVFQVVFGLKMIMVFFQSYRKRCTGTYLENPLNDLPLLQRIQMTKSQENERKEKDNNHSGQHASQIYSVQTEIASAFSPQAKLLLLLMVV